MDRQTRGDVLRKCYNHVTIDKGQVSQNEITILSFAFYIVFNECSNRTVKSWVGNFIE